MACVPKGFRCIFEMSSGPMEDVYFFLNDGLTNHLSCKWCHVSVLGNGVQALSMCLSSLLCLSQHTDAECLFSLTACALSQSLLLLCVRASCVSSLVYPYICY